MKYKAILSAIAAVALLAACEDNISEREKLDSRTVSQLDVQYSVAGKAVSSLSFDHAFARSVVEVGVSNDGLRWDLESNSDWCRVVPAEHRGSGSVTLEIEANESFEDRESATLTFVAGDYRGFRIQVDQSAATFIISQPYFVAGLKGGAFNVNVTTLSDTDWTVDSEEDWLSVVRNPAGAPVDGTVTTALQLNVGTDYDDSRLGAVELASGSETDVIRLWQFGTDVAWKDGSIFFGTEVSSFSMIAPMTQVRKVNYPEEYTTLRSDRIDDVLEKLTFTLDQNLSDCSAARDVAVSLTLSNNTSTEVPLPAIKQDYIPAGGLMTAEGMLLFAQKVAAGESTADWQNDQGWVTMLRDIDMSGVADWPGIGTAEHPFSGKFDGKGHSFTRLTQSSNGLFAYCEGAGESGEATIKDVKLDKKCSFYRNQEDWTAETRFGCIANHAVRTYISGCTSSASVEFAGSASNSSPAYFGGILGKGGAGVSLHNCRIVECEMKFTSSCDSAYVAGIAGKASSVDGCTMNGTLTVKDGNVGELYLAGVTPVINEASDVSGNTFGGVLVVGGNSLHNYVGGLYSKTVTGFTKVFDSGSDGSSSSGTIRIDSHRDAADCRVYAGGILGCAAPSATLTFKDYSVQAKFILDHAKARKAGYYCVGGVLGGTDPGTKAKSVTFEGINYQGLMSFRFAKGIASGIVKGYYGGVAGFVKGPSTFKDCTNQGNVGVTTSDSNINAGVKNETSANFVGGVAGYLEGGNVTMTSCKNEAMVLNLFYCNLSAYNNPDLNYLQDFRGAFCGGILGAFDMHLEPSGETITLSDCDCSASVDGIRGMVGGVVGFCQNATITNCDYSSKEYTTLGNQIGSHQGGVAGAVSKATIEGSVVKATIHAGQPGSSDFASPGGIVGRVIPGDKVVVKDCRFYGTVIATPSNGTTLYPGGIVGAGCANTEVKDCSFGGTIKETDKDKTTETLSKEISKNNLATYVFGNQTGTATNISVWAGQ